MQRFQGTVSSITLEPTGAAAMEIICPVHKRPGPGQVLLALSPTENLPLRKELYPVQLLERGFRTDPACGIPWEPGTTLDLLGPLGQPIDPPHDREKWLLISYGTSFNRLLPLVDEGLARGVNLSCWSDLSLPRLPPGVEFEPVLANVLPWADYLAVAVSAEKIDTCVAMLDPIRVLPSELPGHFLITMPLTCGLGLCHSCEIQTRKGHQLVCNDGPVFNLQDFI